LVVIGETTLIDDVAFEEFVAPVYPLKMKSVDDGVATRETLVPTGT
jgi:hypothetical protein